MEIPETFKTTLSDFLRDLTNTFPEYSDKWANLEIPAVFSHCLEVYPERFFDLLYQNDDIFKPDSTTNTVFLPNVDFKMLFQTEGVTETTKKSIWKYLQLLMFSLIGSVKDKSNFGDSMNMFEGIDEADLQSKMKETMDSIGDFFKNMNMSEDDMPEGDLPSEEQQEEKTEFNFEKTQGMPNLNDLHEHLKGLFDGKIGRLAKNIAEEISGDFEKILGDDYKDVKSTKDIFTKMMKNPKNMMDMVKKVGDKIKSKMDSGEISKDDIMSEAGEILRKMKEMSGGSDDKLQEMLKTMAKNMGMGGGKNMRVDTNALNRMTKMEAMRERMRKKAQSKTAAQKAPPPTPSYVLEQTGQSNYVFKLPDEGEQPKSAISAPKYTEEELIAEFTKKDATMIKPNKKKKSKAKK